MDFQQAENVTPTQALADGSNSSEYFAPQLLPPLNAEHVALRSDFELITLAAMDRLYHRITADVAKSVADTAMAFQKTTNQLHNQIHSLGARVTQLQQQLLAYQHPVSTPVAAPAIVPAKKILKKTLTKKATTGDTASTATATGNATPTVVSAIPLKPPTNTPGWETVLPKPQKPKATPPKLIPTNYPQAEREVICHFQNTDDNTTNGIPPEKTYDEQQTMADMALRRVNSAIIDNKDLLAPPFIHACVTVWGNILFTTGTTQSNIVYEDYTTIIADALSYYGQYEKVEIGRRFSHFLLHGVPTHFSIPEISDSITTNYPQLVQGQTPCWLTPAERREHKTNSTIFMTLTGSVKKTAIGHQNLIVCNCECQLDDYIPYGRSTQCRNCQAYGHLAALCQNNSCCAVCAGCHETREHLCTLPTCRKGPTCTHPPIRCANCNSPHKATDPNCPERVNLQTFNKATGVAIHGGSGQLNGPPCIRWVGAAAELRARPSNGNFSFTRFCPKARKPHLPTSRTMV